MRYASCGYLRDRRGSIPHPKVSNLSPHDCRRDATPTFLEVGSLDLAW